MGGDAAINLRESVKEKLGDKMAAAVERLEEQAGEARELRRQVVRLKGRVQHLSGHVEELSDQVKVLSDAAGEKLGEKS